MMYHSKSFISLVRCYCVGLMLPQLIKGDSLSSEEEGILNKLEKEFGFFTRFAQRLQKKNCFFLSYEISHENETNYYDVVEISVKLPFTLDVMRILFQDIKNKIHELYKFCDSINKDPTKKISQDQINTAVETAKSGQLKNKDQNPNNFEESTNYCLDYNKINITDIHPDFKAQDILIRMQKYEIPIIYSKSIFEKRTENSNVSIHVKNKGIIEVESLKIELHKVFRPRQNNENEAKIIEPAKSKELCLLQEAVERINNDLKLVFNNSDEIIEFKIS